MKAKPLICGNLYYQSQGSHLQMTNKEGFCLHGQTWAPHLVPGILSARPARAASLLPFSPLIGQRGENGTRTKTWAKERCRCALGGVRVTSRSPSNLKRLPEAVLGLAPGRGTESGWGRAARGGRARQTRRKGSGGRRSAPPVFGPRTNAAARPQPGRRARGGRLRPHPAAACAPGSPGAAGPRACQQGAARSPQAPRPHLARSVAEAGQAQRARPARGRCGDPAAPGARPRPGQMTARRGALPGRAATAPRAPGQVQ